MAGRNATWALVSGEEIMNIIDCLQGYEMANQLARGCYGDEAFAVNVNQWTCSIGDFYKDGGFGYTDEETEEDVFYERLLSDEEEIQLLKSETAGLMETVYPTINVVTCTLDELKIFRQKENKILLSSFLEENPLLWIDGEYYGVTKENQDEMIADKAAYDLKQAIGETGWKLEWHNVNKACREFTEEEFVGLLNAIINFIYPYRRLQETYKELIFSAETKEDVIALNLEYSVFTE